MNLHELNKSTLYIFDVGLINVHQMNYFEITGFAFAVFSISQLFSDNKTASRKIYLCEEWKILLTFFTD